MKKLVYLAAAVLGFASMNAQKNGILLQGNVGYNISEVKVGDVKTNVTDFKIQPMLGFRFSENMLIGAEASFLKSDLNSDKTIPERRFTRLGGFYRMIKPLDETFSIYGDFRGGWQQQKLLGQTSLNMVGAEQTSLDSKGRIVNEADGFYVGFTPALFINFRNDFGLNFSIGGVEYSQLKDKDSNSANSSNNNQSKTSDNVAINFGKSINIGISKNFSFN